MAKKALEILKGSRKEKVKPGITVVIPIFNRLGQVERTLDALAAQTRLPEAVILVDNGSGDGSWEYLFKWKEEVESRGMRVSVKREPRPGAAQARDTGMQFVDTEYVMFFDSDDYMTPVHIETIMNDFNSDPELDITAWPVKFISEEVKKPRRRVWVNGDRKRIMDNHLVQGLLSTQGYAVKSEFFRNAGGWNPGIGGWDDFELGLRLLMNNPKIKLSSVSNVIVTVQEKSISGLGYSHRMGDWERTLDIMEMEVLNSEDPLREHILRMIAYRRVNLAAHYKLEGNVEESKALKELALDNRFLTRRDSIILKLAYRYTSTGLPGAGAFLAPFIS